jgi:hypothetical protein
MTKTSNKKTLETRLEERIKKEGSEGKEMIVAVLDKMNVLFTSGMGLVAALAWNEAIKNMFDQIFPQQDKNSIWALFGYAVVVTIVIVVVTYRLTKLVERFKKTDKNKKK